MIQTFYVVEFDPENEKRFIVFRSSKTSGTVEKKGVSFSVEHKTLNAIRQSSSGPKIIQTTGYFVNLTKLFLARVWRVLDLCVILGIKIVLVPPRLGTLTLEKNAGLVTGSTTFGMTLETMHDVTKLVITHHGNTLVLSGVTLILKVNKEFVLCL